MIGIFQKAHLVRALLLFSLNIYFAVRYHGIKISELIFLFYFIPIYLTEEATCITWSQCWWSGTYLRSARFTNCSWVIRFNYRLMSSATCMLFQSSDLFIVGLSRQNENRIIKHNEKMTMWTHQERDNALPFCRSGAFAMTSFRLIMNVVWSYNFGTMFCRLIVLRSIFA